MQLSATAALVLLVADPAAAYVRSAPPRLRAPPRARVRTPQLADGARRAELTTKVENFQATMSDRLQALRHEWMLRERDEREEDYAVALANTDHTEREDAASRAILQLDANELHSSETGELKMRQCPPLAHWIEEAAEVVEKGTVPSLMLIAATGFHDLSIRS